MKVDNNMMAGFYEGIWSVIIMFMASSVFPVAVIIVLLIIILKRRIPVMKGKYGESVVKGKLQNLGDAYTVFHDVNIPNGERGLTQVDHIVTSVYGVFVIETKHYDGWIFGDEFRPSWTQVIYKKKSKMHNPIRQNYGHVQALRTYIGQEELKDIHSIIAFSPSSTFKFKKAFTSAHVIQFPELLTTIEQYKEHRISESTVKGINVKLTKLLATDKKDRKRLKAEHMQSIRKVKDAEQKVLAQTGAKNMSKRTASSIQTACPKCNGQLTLKSGRYGKFYGCSNYPDCRYTENLEVDQRSV